MHKADIGQDPEDPPVIADIVLNELVKHHTYDALGRLARTLSPYPDPSNTSNLRSERFYYDGIRRLVEVQIDTVKSLAGALASGNGTYEDLAEDALALSAGDIDPSQAPAAYEVAYIAAASPTITTAREYIWGPGDRGVYELLCQFDSAGTAVWILQDEGGDVVGAADNGGLSAAARLIGHWSYDPYGNVIAAGTTATPALVHAGHKGLFVDRLDGGIATGLGAENARLGIGAKHAIDMDGWNYLPFLGRWAQADSRETGLLQSNVWAISGRSHAPGIAGVNMDLLLGAGSNLFQYSGGNPWVGRNPLQNHFGWRNPPNPRGTGGMSLLAIALANAALSGAHSGGSGGAEWDPFEVALAISGEHLWSGLVGVNKALYLAKEGTRLARAYEQVAFQWDELVMDRDEAILFSMIVGPFFSTICFEAGTPLATPEGAEPIECLTLGCEVTSAPDPEHAREDDDREPDLSVDALRIVRLRYLRPNGAVTTMELLRPAALIDSLRIVPGMRLSISVDEMALSGPAEVLSVEPYNGRIPAGVPVVTGRFVTEGAEIVDLNIRGFDRAIGVTPLHRVFSIDCGTWVAAGDLCPGERLRTLQGVAIVEGVTPRLEPETVYNVEVSHDHTYFVGQAEIWAHNPCFEKDGTRLWVKLDDDLLDMSVDTLRSLDDLAELVRSARAWGTAKGAAQGIMDIKFVAGDLYHVLSYAVHSGGRILGARVYQIGEFVHQFRLVWGEL